MTTKKTIILNCCPPTHVMLPTFSISVLHGFLESHGYNVKSIYWSLLSAISDPDPLQVFTSLQVDEERALLPYCYLLAQEFDDQKLLKSLRVKWLSRFPRQAFNGPADDPRATSLEVQAHKLKALIDSELDKINEDEVSFFGFSAKHSHWIASTYIAMEMKKRFPSLKIAIGGFLYEEAAKSMIDMFECYDYVIWGEGEVPLLSLAEGIEGGAESFDFVPNLYYRQNGIVRTEPLPDERTVVLDQRPYPNYDDYFATIEAVNLPPESRAYVALPIEGSRGCCWGKCAFCTDYLGTHTRERGVSEIVAEMEHMSQKYGVNIFYFVDLNLAGETKERFTELLSAITESTLKRGRAYYMGGYMIQKNCSDEIIKLMRSSGFEFIDVGFEGMSEGALAKFNKSTNLADNMAFLKFSHKYGVFFNTMHLIKDYPNETEDDILESIDNLHYLRFILGGKFKFETLKFYLGKGSRYYGDASNKQEYTESELQRILPQQMIGDEFRFDFFLHCTRQEYNPLWKVFDEIQDYYMQHSSEYLIFEMNGEHYYREYLDREELFTIALSPLQWAVLEIANDQSVSLGDVIGELAKSDVAVSEDEVKAVIEELKERAVLFATSDFSGIISMIDTTISRKC